MIRAIIFDCFGVLTTDGWLAFRHKYLKEGSVEEDQACHLNRQTDMGMISHREFVDAIAKLAKVSPEEAALVVNDHVRNDHLFEFIKQELKLHYKIGLLSNAAADYTSELFEPWQTKLFDAMTFSFELGAVKPDAVTYRQIAAKLGVEPEECVFVDDRVSFADGARSTGMKSIWYRSNEQCQRELADLLGSADTTDA